jgi:hypothetical protein
VVKAWVRQKRKYVPKPGTPCFCTRGKNLPRCGLCNAVLRTELEKGSACCEECAKSIADSTGLKRKKA